MHTRNSTILQAVVEEYVRLAQPIGSHYLARQRVFDVSSATIRAILQELENDGYLYQPHPSAGRIPTNQGYRYYVDHVSVTPMTIDDLDQLTQQLKVIQLAHRSATRATSQLLAERAHTVAISADLVSGDIHEVGLGELLAQPESSERELMQEISEWLDRAEEYIEYLTQYDQKTEVFIGDENPAFPMHRTSLLVRAVTRPGGDRLIICLVGPTRMAYNNNQSLLESMATLINSLPL